MKTQPEIVQELVAGGKARTSREFTDAGVTRACLAREVAKKNLFQWQRGVYCEPEIPAGMDYAALSLVLPGGVVCLQSAASIHGISDENPNALWYAMDRAKSKSVPGDKTHSRTPIARLYWTGDSLTVGVETMVFAGVPVQVTGKARTVVDMIRRSLRAGAGGGEQPVRALKDFLQQKGDIGEVWDIATKLKCIDQLEPLLRVAEEMSTVMQMPGRM